MLGPFEAFRGGRVLDIGAGKQRALCAVLLLKANEVVSTDRLIDELWPEQPPPTAAKILQGYVSRLRKALDEVHGSRILITRPPGYVLRLAEGQLDSERFAALLVRGRAALAAGAASDASRLLREALALWRGPPLADFTFESFARDEIARLEELRLAALEERIDADLELGREGELVAELEALVSRHPLRERVRGQLMRALYRNGRQGEALETYQDARRALVEGLGLEPGRRLQELEQAILRQDPSLDPPPQPRPATPVASPGDAYPAPARSRGAFVGREREFAMLLHAFREALSGRGRVVAVGGEPGIGKSRLAEELAARAEAGRAEVLWGRCPEVEGASPYRPWVQALRSCVRGRDPEQLRADLGSGAPDIAGLLADVREVLPDLPQPVAAADPQQARFRLFDAIASFFEKASRSRPLVVVLEDLNWADSGSLLLLEFVARELRDARVLLVGTYRDVELSRRHPLSRALAELSRESSFERVLLRGLSDVDVGRFVESACGFAPDQAFVQAIHGQTEGNPFFVSEVVRLLWEEGALSAEGSRGPARWSGRIPEGVRETIGRRLDRLSEACNEALAIASAIGREFSLDRLAGLVDGSSEEDLLEVLEQALAAHIVEELPGAGQYQFTHALIHATLADDLPVARRARLHARIVELLEEAYGDEAGNHAVELARHVAEAAALLGPEKLVHYSRLAGESALASYAPEQALLHFERALVAGQGRLADRETADLMFGLGRAQLATLAPDQLDPAVTSLRRAFEHYVRSGDTSAAVAVAAYPLPLSLRFGYTDVKELIARALTLVDPDSHEAGGLLAQRAWFTGFIDADYDGAQPAFQEALRIAERDADPALERRTLASAAFVDAFHFRWQDCTAKALRAIALTREVDDVRTEMAAHRSISFALVSTGELEEGRRHTEVALAHAEQLRERWWVSSTSFSHELLCLYEGDWETARRMSALGLHAEPRDPRHLALRALLELEVGDQSEGVACITRLREVAESVRPPGPIADHVFVAMTLPLAAGVAGPDDWHGVAEAAAEGVLSLSRVAPALATYARSGLALLAVQLGDVEAAKQLHVELRAQAGTASFFVPLTLDRVLGLLAATCGWFDIAADHFEAGLSFCRRAGYLPEYGQTACDYALMLLERGLRNDQEKARALWGEAETVARDLDMTSLRERVLALRARS